MTQMQLNLRSRYPSGRALRSFLLQSSSFGGAFKPGTSIFGCVLCITDQSGRCDASIMTTESSGLCSPARAHTTRES
jgi:hypothetical protein